MRVLSLGGAGAVCQHATRDLAEFSDFGDVRHRGVIPPETAIDPGIFFGELARRRIEIYETVQAV